MKMNDPIYAQRAHRAQCLNSSTIPVVHKMRTESLGEFLPEIWEELRKMPISYRIVAEQIYEGVKRRCERIS